jgi:hypothetical protein
VDNHQQKISHLKVLYHLACADEILSEVEAVFIRNVATYLGVSDDELSNFDTAEPTLELPDREYKIYALFHRLAIVVMIDNELNEKERHYCFNLGVKMGLHPNAVGEIIDYVSSKGTFDALPAEVMGIFKKYLN